MTNITITNLNRNTNKLKLFRIKKNTGAHNIRMYKNIEFWAKN